MSGCQDNVILSGRVYLDETYFSVKPKDKEKKGGKLLRGLSRNKICVATATDGKHVILAVKDNIKITNWDEIKITKIGENYFIPIGENYLVLNTGRLRERQAVED